MSEDTDNQPFVQWAIVELMGHVRIAGMVTEEEQFGVKMGRCDIPGPDETIYATMYFSGASIYRVTPTTEAVARQEALRWQPKPAALLQHQASPEYDDEPEDISEVELPF